MSTNTWDDALNKRKRGGERPPKNEGSNEIFMKFQSGKNKFRIVGECQTRWIAWFQGEKIFVPDDKEYVGKVKNILKATPRLNFVCNIIDRADQAERLKAGLSTRFKLLEKGASIFDPILALYEELIDEDTGEKIHPGGPKGQEWMVEADVPANKNQRRQTKYKTVALGPKPFTKEELSVIRRADLNGKNVKDEFKELPIGEKGLIDIDLFYNVEKAKKKIDQIVQDIQDGKIVVTEEEDDNASANNQNNASKKTAAPANNDDMFDSAPAKSAPSTPAEAEGEETDKEAIW